MRLREAEAREADELVEDAVRRLRVDALLAGALDEALAERLQRVVAALAAHRTAQALCLADREARRARSRPRAPGPERRRRRSRPERLSQELVVDRPLVVRVLARRCRRVDVRVHRLALDRPGPHERDLDGDVVEVLGLRAQEALHLRAALDLERADRVRALDVVVDRLVVEGDAREVDHLAARSRDLVDAVLDCREHPEPEEVDLEEAGVGARVLVPLAELTSRHRRRLDRDELDRAGASRRSSRPGAGRRGAAAPRSHRSATRTRASAWTASFRSPSGRRATSSPTASRSSRPRCARAARAPRTGGRAPSRRRGSRRASDKSRSSRRGQRARARSAR